MTGWQAHITTMMDVYRLSPRQRQVVWGVMRGQSNAEIAQDMGCLEQTVKNHLTQAFIRCDVTSRLELCLAILIGPHFAREVGSETGQMIGPAAGSVASLSRHAQRRVS